MPIGIVDVQFGGKCIDASIAPEGFALEPWLKEQQFTLPYYRYAQRAREPDHIALGAVYNCKVRTVAPYGIKGALWYQGDFSVHFVQLQSDWFHDHTGAPPSGEPDGEDGIGLAITRMELFKSLQITNTGMAVAIDIGGGLHPGNKFDVGERLALWALRDRYGRKDLVVSGPLYKDMKIEGNKIRLKFDHVGSGLMVGKKVGSAPTVQVIPPRSPTPVPVLTVSGAAGGKAIY